MTKLDALVKAFNKRYSRDVSGNLIEDPPRLPSGIFDLDLALGGGFPIGRASIIYGHEAAMKTTICLKASGMAQQMFPKLTPVFMDVEGHFSKKWARTVGCDPAKLIVLRPQTAEEMIDMAESILLAEDVSVVTVDSLAALVTMRELDSNAEDSTPGTSGLAIGKFYRKAGVAFHKAAEKGRSPTLLCINQIRYKIGVMMGDPETMPGGQPFKFFSSLTLRVSGKDEWDKKLSTSLPAFRKVGVIVKKHKIAITQRNSEFSIALLDNPKLGLKPGEPNSLPRILYLLKAFGLIQKREGGGYEFRHEGKVHKFEKAEGVKIRLVSDPEFRERATAAVVAKALTDGLNFGEEDDEE